MRLHYYWFRVSLALLLPMTLMVSCGKKELTPEEMFRRGAKIITAGTSNINMHSAILYGYVNPKAYSSDRWVAFEISTSPDFLFPKGYTFYGELDVHNGFYCQVDGLANSTTYYYRAVINSKVWLSKTDLEVGEIRSFKTKDFEAIAEAVDLGLSVKWSKFNLGATSPYEYGAYFIWGTTTPLEIDKWDNPDPSILYEDAARVNLGEGWRLPTDAEFTELREQCDWDWITEDNVSGYKVSSRVNENSIFLPAAGAGFTDFVNTQGYYLSSTISDKDDNIAYGLIFHPNSVARNTMSHRSVPESIRPVTQ